MKGAIRCSGVQFAAEIKRKMTIRSWLIGGLPEGSGDGMCVQRFHACLSGSEVYASPSPYRMFLHNVCVNG